MELIHDENTLNTAPRDASNFLSKSFKKMGMSTKSTHRKAFTSIDVNSLTRSTSDVSLKTQDSKPLSTRTNSAPKLNGDCTRCCPNAENETVEAYGQCRNESEDISSIFRAKAQEDCKALDGSSREFGHSMRTLRKATAISEQPYEVSLSRKSSGTLQLFDSHRVTNMRISSIFEVKCSKIESEPTHRVFREAPNEDIFTEEMEMMMTLKIANPIQESDTEYEGDISYDDFSVDYNE